MRRHQCRGPCCCSPKLPKMPPPLPLRGHGSSLMYAPFGRCQHLLKSSAAGGRSSAGSRDGFLLSTSTGCFSPPPATEATRRKKRQMRKTPASLFSASGWQLQPHAPRWVVAQIVILAVVVLVVTSVSSALRPALAEPLSLLASSFMCGLEAELLPLEYHRQTATGCKHPRHSPLGRATLAKACRPLPPVTSIQWQVPIPQPLGRPW